MLARSAIRAVRNSQFSLVRAFSSDKKPPKGFEKFYKKKEGKQEEAKKPEEKAQQPDNEPSSKTDFSDSESGSSRWSKSWNFNFNPNPNFKPWWFIPALFGLGGYVYVSQFSNNHEIPEITFQDLCRHYLQENKVRMVSIMVNRQPQGMTNLHEIHIVGLDNRPFAKLRVPDIQGFLKQFEAEQLHSGMERGSLIPVAYKESSSKSFGDYSETVSKVFGFVVNAGLMCMILMLLWRMSGGGSKGGGNSGGGGGGFGDMFGMSKQNFKVYGTDVKVNVKFNQVAGLQEAKKEIMEFVEFLKNPQKFRTLGAKIPRGALLVGPPGTGKTLLAKATAGEAKVPFFSISGSDFVEMFVGVGASRVRQLFKQAKEKAPSIIFIDEIDAVGRKRSGKMGGNDERDNTLNQLLVEMDGFGTDTNVVILAGTNRADILDDALKRPGRFDRTIELTLPDLQGREEILGVHLTPLLLDPAHEKGYYAKHLAALTPGFSGADLMNICNEAAILAARHDKEHISEGDFESATERVIGGLEKAKTLTAKEQKVVAHHEAGHAVTGWFLEGADPVLKVSILPRSKGALGFAQFLPNETMLYTEQELLDKICTALGGRVAENLFFGRVTTGAQDDLKKCTQIAQAIVTNFGMNAKLGMVGYDTNSEQFSKPYSEDTNKIIDEEVRGIIGKCLSQTRELLETHREKVAALAGRLIDQERVIHSDLVEILGVRPFEAKDNYAKYIEHQDEVVEEDKNEDPPAEAVEEAPSN